VANEVVEKYRLEGDTSAASAAVKKFEAEHDRSLSAVERRAKIAAIEQQAAAERAAAAQAAAANKAADAQKTAADKAAAAQEKAMQRAMAKVELLNEAFRLAVRAVEALGRAAIEYEKDLETQDRVVTHLADSWERMVQNSAGNVAQWGPVRSVIQDLTDDLNEMAAAAESGDVGAWLTGATGIRDVIGGRKGDPNAWFDPERARKDMGLDKASLAAEREREQAADKERRRQEKARDRAEKIRELNKAIFKGALEEQALQDKRELDAWQFKEDAKTKIAEEAEKNRLDVVKRGEEWQEKQQAESLRKFEKAQAERQALMEANAQEASQVSTTIASTFAEGVDAVIEGGTLGFGKFLAGLGRTIGTMLIGRGAADVSMGNATSANIYTPGMGIPQTTMGGIEIALGSAMLVGGLAAGAAMANGGGGGGAGGAGSAGATAMPTQQTPETITINLTTMGKWGQSEHAAFQRQVGGALGRRYR